jgi:hypothetical protein
MIPLKCSLRVQMIPSLLDHEIIYDPPHLYSPCLHIRYDPLYCSPQVQMIPSIIDPQII